MKKLTYALACLTMGVLLVAGGTLRAQNLTLDFQANSIGDSLSHIGWSPSDIQAVIADDPVNPGQGNHVLKCTIHNYNAAPVLTVVLPAGKTLADYSMFNFKGYFAQGDVGYKDIVVEAYQTKPTAQAFNNAAVKVGSYNRAQNGSTAWENISINIAGSASMTDTVYLAFGINCAGTGNVGGTGVTTIWYADSVTLVAKPSAPADTTLVTQWGSIGGRTGGGWWKIKTGVPGSASTVGDSVPKGQWATIRGGFTNPVTASAGANGAVVVTGQIQFVGSGPVTWSGLRYGLFRHDSAGTVLYAGTDSARWSGKENYAYGYMFTPQSGTVYSGNIPSFANGGGSQGVTKGGSWISTYGGAQQFGGLINQAPARAVFDSGTYNFAFSVQPQSDGSNEVRFYMVKTGTPVKYWYGGVLKDTSHISMTFNGVCFGLDPNYVEATSPIRGMNLSNVRATTGAPITVPSAPWEAFYVDQWGKFAREGGWHFQVDPDTIIGNAGVAGSAVPAGNWVTLRGGFVVPVTASPESAIVVTGQIQFVGSGPVTWSGLRYGLFRSDSAGTVQYANTDSARWGKIVSGAFAAGLETYSYGYMFTPQSATTYSGNLPSYSNGGASQGVTRGGSWISTYGNPPAMGFGGLIAQQPARAVFDAGTYNWGISVQPQSDGSNEVRFYMYRDSSVVTYWYGGTLKDTSHITKTFNGVCFGLDPNYVEATSPIRAMILTNVKVDLGTPLNVPAPPWQNYYVDTWGFYGGQIGGWQLTPGDVIGNATISGSAPTTGWTAVRGAFFSPASARDANDSALVVNGDIEFVGGGFERPGSFRFGLFNSANAGNIAIDSASDSSNVWNGAGTQNSGYLFIPLSGTNAPIDWYGHSTGSWGGIVNGIWDSTSAGYVLGNGVLKPANAVASSGMYHFQITIAPAGNGANMVGFELTKSDGSYKFGETVIDDHSPVAATQFNSIGFALNGGTTTAMNLENIQVTLAKPPVVTGVKSATGAVLPKVYSLSQNYPNPFNPSTTLRYDIPKTSQVKIIIYDVLGRAVTTLVDGVQAANSYTITWNAQRFSSGVYFCRIEARAQDGSGNFTSLKKLLFMK